MAILPNTCPRAFRVYDAKTRAPVTVESFHNLAPGSNPSPLEFGTQAAAEALARACCDVHRRLFFAAPVFAAEKTPQRCFS